MIAAHCFVRLLDTMVPKDEKGQRPMVMNLVTLLAMGFIVFCALQVQQLGAVIGTEANRLNSFDFPQDWQRPK